MDILRQTGQDLKEAWNVSFEEFLGELDITQEDYELTIRSDLKRIEIMLKRHPIDIRTNQFCLDLSEVWLANTDVKYVLDAFACAQVCTESINMHMCANACTQAHAHRHTPAP
ncbi:MAG: hypothetical protein GY820_06390 [Gammaproteobacteria bacterium]|nr:hypothetical protein [Gammaproteobacteria bacterium]